MSVEWFASCKEPPHNNGIVLFCDPKLSAGALRLGMQGELRINAPDARNGRDYSCFGAALNTAGPGWWIPQR
jgi:hypothetical protein